ncbi:MAG: hypothetical protein LBQ10_08055 [Desulfovibrio sp.]|jgi:hypothetical protein|nr:hypothetical protein [Desulfovibrio sp.]
MKIRPDQLNNLLPTQGVTTAAPGGQTKTRSVFDDILAEEQLRANAESGDSAAVPAPPGAGRTDLIRSMLLGGAEGEKPVSSEEAVLNEAFNQVAGTLDVLDKYSISLGSARPLREAYSLLDDVDGRVAGLEKGADTLRAQYPALDSLLNELKIISVTEKIKFNRGDYLPE